MPMILVLEDDPELNQKLFLKQLRFLCLLLKIHLIVWQLVLVNHSRILK